jgi:hypothetical protein
MPGRPRSMFIAIHAYMALTFLKALLNVPS